MAKVIIPITGEMELPNPKAIFSATAPKVIKRTVTATIEVDTEVIKRIFAAALEEETTPGAGPTDQ